MRGLLTPLLQFQRFFIPVVVLLALWAMWRTLVKKDFAVGLVLYLSLVVVVDGFMNTGIYIPGLSFGSIRYSEAFALLLFAVRPKTEPHQPPHKAVLTLIVLYFLLMFIAVLRVTPVLDAVLEFRTKIIPQIVALTLAIRGLRSAEDHKRFFLALTPLLIFMGLFVFFDLFFDRMILKSDMLDKAIYLTNRNHNRFGSFLLNPNYLGGFLVLVFPAMFVYTINETQTWKRVCAWTALLMMVFSLVQTQSRGAMLAFGVAVLFLVVGPCGGVSRKRRIGLLALCCTMFLVFMPGFIDHALQRFDHMETETREGRSRETTWQYALRMIGNHPLDGIGFGETQFTKEMVAYGFESEYGVKALDAPHNSYLQVAVYIGIPGLLCFLLGNMLVLKRAAGISLKSEGHPDTGTIFGLAVGILGFLASIFTDLQLFTPNVGPAYWIFFALLLSLATKKVTESTAETRRLFPVKRFVRRPTGVGTFAQLSQPGRSGVRK